MITCTCTDCQRKAPSVGNAAGSDSFTFLLHAGPQVQVTFHGANHQQQFNNKSFSGHPWRRVQSTFCFRAFGFGLNSSTDASRCKNPTYCVSMEVCELGGPVVERCLRFVEEDEQDTTASLDGKAG